MSDVEIFDYLVLGLAKLQDHPYPYPDLFQHACNRLALTLEKVTYPRTFSGLLKLLEAPVRDWYPLELPEEFDPEFGLML